MGRDLFRRQFRPREKGGAAVGKTKRGKGKKWMVMVDGQGLPLGVRLESATTAVVTAAIVGTRVNTLPPNCTTFVANGVSYQNCGGNYYQPQFCGGNTTYVVVNQP